MLRTLLPALLLVLLGTFALPAHAADTSIGLLQCYASNWDADHDGDADAWTFCSTPPCGCMCPYAGAAVVVDAAGQERGAAAVVSCTSGYGTTSGASDGGAPVTVVPIAGGGAAGTSLPGILGP